MSGGLTSPRSTSRSPPYPGAASRPVVAEMSGAAVCCTGDGWGALLLAPTVVALVLANSPCEAQVYPSNENRTVMQARKDSLGASCWESPTR